MAKDNLGPKHCVLGTLTGRSKYVGGPQLCTGALTISGVNRSQSTGIARLLSGNGVQMVEDKGSFELGIGWADDVLLLSKPMCSVPFAGQAGQASQHGG